MTTQQGPVFGRILRTMSLLGSASLVSVFLGVLKMKVAAVVLGPVGIGLIALLQNAVGVAGTIGDMGMRQSGAREISRERVVVENQDVPRVLLTLCCLGLFFAFLASGLFYAFRGAMAGRLLARPDLVDELGWATIAVAATILAAVLTAILNGHHRVREITAVTIHSALLSCILSVAAIWFWRERGIIVFVVSGPLMLMLVSFWYVVRIGALPPLALPSKVHAKLAGRLLQLGVFVMGSAIVLSLSELAVRLAIQRQSGAVELGLFSAAWAIGVYYLNFLMVATSTEFFPRLASRFEETDNRNAAINMQIQAMCFVAAPVVIALSAFCPLIMRLLYSTQFLDATSLVRLMVIGDVLRLAVYPMGFVLLAASHGRSFFLLKLAEGGIFAGLVIVLLPRLGLEGVGVAHIATFAVLFVGYCATLSMSLGFRFSYRSAASIAGLLAIAASLAIIASRGDPGAMAAGGMFLLAWGAAAAMAWAKQRKIATDGLHQATEQESRNVP